MAGCSVLGHLQLQPKGACIDHFTTRELKCGANTSIVVKTEAIKRRKESHMSDRYNMTMYIHSEQLGKLRNTPIEVHRVKGAPCTTPSWFCCRVR